MSAKKRQQAHSGYRDSADPRPFHGTHRIQVDPFFQVPLYTQAFSRGDVQLPVLVQDASAVYCQFISPLERVRELLKDTPLEPVFVLGSRALIGLALYQNHQCTVGSHLNMNLVVPVVRRTGFKRPSSWKEIRMTGDRRHIGFYPIDSALDSALMQAVGREIWGYPKSLTQLRMHFDGPRLYAECNEFDGRHGIARLVGSGMRLMRFPAIDLTMYTLKSRELLRSVINTRGHFDLHLPFGFRLQVGDSDHPMAQRLRYLGLDNARPLIALSCSDYQARMNAGATVDVLQES